MVLPCDPVKSNPKSTLSWGDRTYFADNDKTCKAPLASFSLVLLLCVYIYILYNHMKVIIYSYHYHCVIICPSRMNPWSIWINMDHCMIMVCWCLLMFVANAFNSWQVITSLRARLVPKTATAALMPPTKGAPLDFDHVFWGVVFALSLHCWVCKADFYENALTESNKSVQISSEKSLSCQPCHKVCLLHRWIWVQQEARVCASGRLQWFGYRKPSNTLLTKSLDIFGLAAQHCSMLLVWTSLVLLLSFSRWFRRLDDSCRRWSGCRPWLVCVGDLPSPIGRAWCQRRLSTLVPWSKLVKVGQSRSKLVKVGQSVEWQWQVTSWHGAAWCGKECHGSAQRFSQAR